MTNRIRSQHGNVIAVDFRPQPRTGSLNLSMSVETLFADEHTILLRCRIGSQIWHMLGDTATGKVIST
jgi:hypothetical protein